MRTSLRLAMAALLALPVMAQAPAKKAPVKAAPVLPGTEVVLDTDKGEIVMKLLSEIAPLHCQLVVKTAKAGGYDGTTFHRLIMGGIIQGGDPLSKDPGKKGLYGTGGLDLVKAEFSDRPFVRGAVGTARKSAPDSGGVQFFIVLREQAAWNGKYTVFAEVTKGIEVADQISTMPVDGDKAVDRIVIRKATVRTPEVQ